MALYGKLLRSYRSGGRFCFTKASSCQGNQLTKLIIQQQQLSTGIYRHNNRTSFVVITDRLLRDSSCFRPQDMQVREYNNAGDEPQPKSDGVYNKKDPPIKNKDGFHEDSEPNALVKLKLLFRDYGPAAFVVHIAISLTSLGFWYAMVEYGLPMEQIINWCGTQELSQSVAVKATSNFLVAYAIHKTIMPIRVVATCCVTPVLVGYLRRKGILKPHHVKQQWFTSFDLVKLGSNFCCILLFILILEDNAVNVNRV